MNRASNLMCNGLMGGPGILVCLQRLDGWARLPGLSAEALWVGQTFWPACRSLMCGPGFPACLQELDVWARFLDLSAEA